MPDDIETKKQTSKPAAKPRRKDAVLRAPPVDGEIDRAALTREIIAKFPKILAALAK